MRLRLRYLRRCRKCRTVKEKQLRSKLLSEPSARTFSKSNSHLHSFAGCAKAFRNYGTSNDPIPTVLSLDLANSWPVSSSLLLLDGSSLSSNEVPPTNNEAHYPSAYHLSGHFPMVVEQESDESSAQHQSTIIKPRLGLPGRFKVLRGLGKLAEKYSDTHLKHIDSVVRYSSSISFRSSLDSRSTGSGSTFSHSAPRDSRATDSVSSQSHPGVIPRTDVEGENTIAASPQTGNSTSNGIPHEVEHLQCATPTTAIAPALTTEERETWDLLVNEENLEPTLVPRPPYAEIYPLIRKCCASFPRGDDDTTCRICGFSTEHRRAARSGVIRYPAKFVNALDFYDNTPLHCAAAAVGHKEFRKIRYLLVRGVEVLHLNTTGETFLHLLCQNGLHTAEDVEGFVDILTELEKDGFPFSTADYHGRTILHNLFQNTDDFIIDIDMLSKIFQIMRTDLNVCDNTGTSVAKCIRTYSIRAPSRYTDQLFEITAPWCRSTSSWDAHRAEEFSRIDNPLTYWLDKILRKDLPEEFVMWIDSSGDTALTDLLKRSHIDDRSLSRIGEIVDEMVIRGARIDARDRNGDTALAIAARRGFLTVVNQLVRRGGNIHNRNYRGVGILKQAEERMEQARNNQKLWSLIYCCHIAMTDFGAVLDPTDQQEWMR